MNEEIIRNYDICLIDSKNLNNCLIEREWYQAERYAKRIVETVRMLKNNKRTNEALNTIWED